MTLPPASAPEATAGRAMPPSLVRLGVFLLAAGVGTVGMLRLFGDADSIETVLGVRVPAFYVAMLAGLVLAHLVTFRTVEPRGWSSIAMGHGAWTPRKLASGVLLGAIAVGGPSLLLLLAGWLRVEPSAPGDWTAAALRTLAILLPAALWEELATRGYLFSLVREWIGARRAIVATSAIFGALHLQNANVTWQSVAVVTLAGIFLGSIRVALDSLAAAWAAHVAWNFVMAALLHTAVSGTGLGSPNYRIVDAGPDWATGGAWGPEAGMITGAGLLVGIYIMLRRGRRGAHSS